MRSHLKALGLSQKSKEEFWRRTCTCASISIHLSGFCLCWQARCNDQFYRIAFFGRRIAISTVTSVATNVRKTNGVRHSTPWEREREREISNLFTILNCCLVLFFSALPQNTRIPLAEAIEFEVFAPVGEPLISIKVIEGMTKEVSECVLLHEFPLAGIKRTLECHHGNSPLEKRSFKKSKKRTQFVKDWFRTQYLYGFHFIIF